MVYFNVSCQVCLMTFTHVGTLKKHLHSQQHRQKMVEVFKSDVFSGYGLFPYIALMDLRVIKDQKHPIIGLSMLTLCFSKESGTNFYLCHVCEEKCQPDKILSHLCHGDHCSNYYSCTDPNVLSFSWIPSMNMRAILRPQLINDIDQKGPGILQVLELTEKLMKPLETSNYSEVMHTLRENCKLNKLIEDVKPKRTMIQTYQSDSNRKHSLLGMVHLVECICDGPTEKRYYLCTLCKLTLATHMIIKHVLSFDHIFTYFDVWHPSTLLPKECYTDYKYFAPTILDFSKQTEEIHASANTEMKQVILNPAEYASVNFSCYAEALKKLESKANENKGSSLIVSVKPGDKLECHTDRAGVRSLSNRVVPRCQLCGDIFETISQYFKHLSKRKHKQMFMNSFSGAQTDGGCEQTGWKPYMGLYTYLQRSSRENKPVFDHIVHPIDEEDHVILKGVSLIVTCINTQIQAEAIYVCFACQESFTESILEQHLESKKHLIDTLFYLNPSRFPFAWQNHLDINALKSAAWKEEKERGPNQAVMMRVLHIPPRVFLNLLPPTYRKVMMKLGLRHSILKDSVPKPETYKYKQNENFPLLGREFMVLYDVGQNDCTKVAILCLLCKRTLSDDERCAHVVSREHVEKFLDCFHPGSLTSHTDAETLLDLAKQAAHIHHTLPVQTIKLENPIWEPCSYYKAISILICAKRRYKQEPLNPPITPKMKLVPRKTVKEMDKDNNQKNSTSEPATSSITLEDSETKTSEKSTDNSDMTLKTIAVEIDPEIANIQCIKSEEHGNEGANKDTLTLSEKESEKRKQLFSEITSEDIKNTGSDTGQLIQEEKTEEPVTRKPSGELPESSQKTEKEDGAETVKETIKNSKEDGKKRPNSISEKSQEDTCPDEHVGGEMENKRQPLTSKEDASCEEPQNMPSSTKVAVVLKQETTADKGESGKPCHEGATDNAPSQMNHQSTDQLWQYIKKKTREPVVGISALHECLCNQHDTIYLCECCSLMIPEKNIINHVVGFHHQKMYLGGLQAMPAQPQSEEIRNLAESFESLNGYGEAQVVGLDEEIYNKILKQDFKSALKAVKSYQAQQESRNELPSTSSLFGAEPVILQVQHEAKYMNDNIQVVGMELDSDSEDPETQPSSVAAETQPSSVAAETQPSSVAAETQPSSVAAETQPSSVAAAISVVTEPAIKTTEVYPESNNNVAMSHTKVPQSANNFNVCLTISRSDENVLNKSKDGIAPKTAVEPLKTETTSISTFTTKILGTSQTFTTSSDTAATAKLIAAKLTSSKTTTAAAPTKCRETTEKCTALTSTSATTKSNCTTAATKFSKTDHKSKSAKLSATNFNCITTTSSAAPTSSCTTSITKSREITNKSATATSSTSAAKSNSSITTTSTAPVSISGTKHRETTGSTVSPQAMATVAAAKMAKAHTDVAPHAHVSNPPAMPHLTTAMFDGSEHKSPPTEPSHTSMTKTRPNCSSPTVGKNQLILVSCERKQQVYCQLCLVRLKHSSHTSSDEHKFNYEKMKDEKDVASRTLQKIEVKHDVYKELAALPAYEAIEKLKAMIKQRAFWEVSPTTEALRQTSASPYEASSPDDVPGKQEHVRPGHQSTPQVLSSISIGASTAGCSNLSIFLAVKNLDTKPIIGLGSVWECQGISRDSFYLCESCREMLLVTEICQHMVSSAHQIRCMMTHYPQFLYFMEDDNVPQEEKQYILMVIAQMFSARERSMRMDAQVVTLTHNLYENVRTASFSEALKMVQNIRKEQKLRVSCQPLNIPHQKYKQPDNQQSQKEFFQMKMQSTLKHQTDHQSDNEARQKAEKHHWEDTRGLDGVKRRKVLSPVGVNSVSSKTFLTETHRSISVQPELRPTVPQDQRPVSELQVKQAEVHSESPSFSTANPKTSQTMSVSPREKCLQSRKRPAPASIETHYTKNSQLKDPRQAKYAHSSLQPVGQCSPGSALESTSVNPSVSPILLGPNDKAIAAGYDEQKALLLIELVKETKFLSKLFPGKSAPDNVEIPSVNNSSQGKVEPRLNSESVQAELKIEKNKTKCYSRCLQVDDTLKENPPAARSVLSANNSSLENPLTTSNLSLKATEASADGTMLASASTADSCDLQDQSSICDLNVFGNANQLKPSSIHSTGTDPNTGLTPQPQGNTETYSAGVCQMPITPIITARPDFVKKQFLGDYTGQDYNEVNTVIKIPSSVSTVSTTNLRNTVAASGGYDQYSQIAYVGTGRHNLTIPSAWWNLQMHNQQQQVQQLPQLPLMVQQQCSSWTSTTLAAEDGKVTNDAPYMSASFSAVANNPQQF